MEFVEPPKESRGERSQRWRDIVYALTDNAGQWAKVGNFSPGVATNIRRAKYSAFYPPGHPAPMDYMDSHWEITTRKTDNGSRNDIYIRYVGNDGR